MQTNPISIMIFTFRAALNKGQLDVAGMLAGLKRIGFDGIEAFPDDIQRDPEAMRRGLASEGLKLACMDVFCDLAGDAETRRKGMDNLRAGVEMAHAFGCDRVLAAGSRLKPDSTPAEARRQIADGLAALAEFANQAGVTLMIENFGMEPELQCRGADCQAVLDMAGHSLKFVFDSGNFLFGDEDMLPNLELLLPRTHHVHIKSWRRLIEQQPGDAGEFGGYIGCPVAEGLIPNRELVNRLLKTGYAGWLSLECSVPDCPLKAAARDFEALKGWLSNPSG